LLVLTAVSAPSRAAPPSPQPAAPTAVDLIIDGIEVTQAVQNPAHTVPLIHGKRTFVRVYAHSAEGSHLTTARLHLQAGNATDTILPIPPGGPFVKVRPSYLKLIKTHAFLFELPWVWTAFFDKVTLTAEVNPNLQWWPRFPKETTYANNSLSRTVSFNAVPTLHVVIAAQPYRFQGQTYSPSFVDQFKLYSWLKQAYPVSKIKLYLRVLPEVQATRKWDPKANAFNLVYPSCGWVNNWLSMSYQSIIGIVFYPDDIVLYGMVADDVGFMRGCAPGIPKAGWNKVRVASGPTGSGSFGWDTDGSYGDWYGGHEIAHAFSQFHVRGGPGAVKAGCGGELKAVKHHPFGYISPTTDVTDPNAHYGFDARNLTTDASPIYGPIWHDVMTYCNYQWISDITTQNLYGQFKTHLPRAAAAPAASYLGVFGLIDVLSNQAELQPVFTLNAIPAAPTPGPYAIVLRDAGGAELARHPFTPLENEPGPSPLDDTAPPILYIAELLPPVAGLARMEVEDPDGAVIGAIAAGPGVPRVKLLSPNGGETLNDPETTVSWQATDPDGDPLYYSVAYSPDAGATWEPVATAITGTQVAIPQFNTAASDQALFRVSASDGLHTGADSSDAVATVPNHLPRVAIVSPAGDVTLAAGQTLSLVAEGYDSDTGSLDENQLTWYSREDGLLGTGETVSTADLTEGVHLISLQADDGQGGFVTATRVVTVVDNPLLLPPPANALAVGPELVLLNPQAGQRDTPLFVEDANPDEAIAWSATVDQPWLALSEAAGTTPAQITLSVDPAGLPPGDYTGLVEFTSRDAPDGRAVVRVSFTVPVFRVVVPVVRR
jgi:hypothetical protein